MLSDEEKKAINNLNFIIVTDIYDNEVSIDKTKIINEYNESVGIVLNLIRKQSKEIEELKREKVKRSWVHIKENGEVEPLFYVSKEKIKAKIEELDKEEKEELKGIKGQDRYAIKQEYMYKRSVLQSLLEKEKI